MFRNFDLNIVYKVLKGTESLSKKGLQFFFINENINLVLIICQ